MLEIGRELAKDIAGKLKILVSSKINIINIVGDHYATLRNERKSRMGFDDAAVFFLIPAAVGIALAAAKFKISEDAVSTIITAMSIFAGLLINVLVLIYTVSQSVDQLSSTRGKEDVEEEKRFLREIFSNVSYAVLISIACVTILVVIIWASGNYRIVLSAIASAFVVHFILTLMMAIKRIHILLTRRFSTN